MTNSLIYFFISGIAHFVGIFMVCAVMTIAHLVDNRTIRSICLGLGILSAMIVLVTAALPYPVVYLGWLGAILVAWRLATRDRPTGVRWGIVALWLVSLGVALWEAQYHLPVSIPLSKHKSLYVIGDSLSIGADAPEQNWPELLGEKLGVTTHSLAVTGARTDTALENARSINEAAALVIIEIGGNDMLERTSGFAENLEALLAAVCADGRDVAMLELPLPPAHNNYGIAQRRLARKYDVTLIPKRYLASVITADGATTDSLHLSNEGHAMLAEVLYSQFDHETP